MTSLMCSKCYRISPNRGERDQTNQVCGEKLSALDPGCTGLMVPVQTNSRPAEVSLPNERQE